MRARVYLAGPEVFLANKREIGAEKRSICAAFGLEGLFPLDAEIKQEPEPEGTALAIYGANVALMDSADAVIANMTPFRGPSMDVGTAFEMGYMAARRKLVLGYTNDPRTYVDRVRAAGLADGSSSVDRSGLDIEDFGLTDNLMMVGSVRIGSARVEMARVEASSEADRIADLGAFRRCVERAAAVLLRPDARRSR